MLPVWVLLALALPVAAAVAAAPPAQQPVNGQARVGLHVAVVDENGTAVPSAHITLTPQQGTAVHGETDYAGRKEFSGLLPGDYSLHVEKEGFFAVTQPGIPVGEVASAEVTLNHIREFSEQVNVVYSPPAIDPAKTQASETLNSEQIIDLPFPVYTRYSLCAAVCCPECFRIPPGSFTWTARARARCTTRLTASMFPIPPPASS